MKEVVIVSAARTPIGKFGKAFKDVTAVELGTVAVKEAIKRELHLGLTVIMNKIKHYKII